MCAKTLATEFWHGPAKLSTPQSRPVCSRSWLRLLLQQPRFTVAQHIHNPPRHAAHHLDHRILSSGVTQDFDDLLRLVAFNNSLNLSGNFRFKWSAVGALVQDDL